MLPTAQKSPDGTPRFTLSLPNSYASDPGLALLFKLESQHAGFEFATRAFFDRHLMPGDIFLDVGAHFGLYAMSAATLLPGNVKVFAFEILIDKGGGRTILGRSLDHRVAKATCDGEVERGRDALPPARQVDIGWSAAVRVAP